MQNVFVNNDNKEIVNQTISEWKDIIEKRLDELTQKPQDFPFPDIYEAVRYSLLKAGKRLRPVLALEFCRACGGDPQTALDCACAVEMIHTYSLIHDDLPCMDDDDLRRGKPSCHAKFGEATALLAGDALQSLAPQTIAECKTLPAEALVRICAELSILDGPRGMIGGQMLDMASEGKKINAETLLTLVSGKTCALIEAACVTGCIAAGADEKTITAARRYAHEFGVAFQIIDDILDVIGDVETLGKPINSDAEENKSTYASLFGLERAGELAAMHTENALAAAFELRGDTTFLKALAVWQLERIN